MSAHYHIIKTDGDKITARKCARELHGLSCPHSDSATTVELVLTHAGQTIPMSSPHVCYELFINNEGAHAVVDGCNSIFVPEKLMDASAVLQEVLTHLDIKNAKANVAKALKLFALLRVKPAERNYSCVKIVEDVFRDARVSDELRTRLHEAHGWFSRCPGMRAVGKGLFCMGFHDRISILQAFATWEGDTLSTQWFDTVGHGALDENIEDFRKLYTSFRKNDKDFLDHVKEVALADPERFFDVNMRPVALRCLGEMNRAFFYRFCSLDGDYAARIESSGAFGILGDGERANIGSKTVTIGGHRVLPGTVSLCRTLVKIKNEGLVRFMTEVDVTALPKNIFNCELTLSGRANAVCEVHALSSCKQMCLAFDDTHLGLGGTGCEALKYRFMEATAPPENSQVTLYVRDAHLLRCGQLGHILWRAAARAALSSIVFTQRFEYDSAYAGPLAPFISALRGRVEQEQTSGNAEFGASGTVEDISLESLAKYSGVCVVPTARDAAMTEVAAEVRVPGTGVFIVSPPSFGTVDKPMSTKRVLIKLAIDSEEIAVPLSFFRKNVFVSKMTRARGTLVPVSALMFQCKRIPSCYTKATVFVPMCFSHEQKRDMITAARAFFLKIQVVFVTTYAPTVQSLTAATQIIQTLEQE